MPMKAVKGGSPSYAYIRGRSAIGFQSFQWRRRWRAKVR